MRGWGACLHLPPSLLLCLSNGAIYWLHNFLFFYDVQKNVRRNLHRSPLCCVFTGSLWLASPASRFPLPLCVQPLGTSFSVAIFHCFWLFFPLRGHPSSCSGSAPDLTPHLSFGVWPVPPAHMSIVNKSAVRSSLCLFIHSACFPQPRLYSTALGLRLRARFRLGLLPFFRALSRRPSHRFFHSIGSVHAGGAFFFYIIVCFSFSPRPMHTFVSAISPGRSLRHTSPPRAPSACFTQLIHHRCHVSLMRTPVSLTHFRRLNI